MQGYGPSARSPARWSRRHFELCKQIMLQTVNIANQFHYESRALGTYEEYLKVNVLSSSTPKTSKNTYKGRVPTTWNGWTSLSPETLEEELPHRPVRVLSREAAPITSNNVNKL